MKAVRPVFRWGRLGPPPPILERKEIANPKRRGSFFIYARPGGRTFTAGSGRDCRRRLPAGAGLGAAAGVALHVCIIAGPADENMKDREKLPEGRRKAG